MKLRSTWIPDGTFRVANGFVERRDMREPTIEPPTAFSVSGYVVTEVIRFIVDRSDDAVAVPLGIYPHRHFRDVPPGITISGRVEREVL